MEARNSHFAAFIDLFTENTYMMVIMSDPTIRTSTPSTSPFTAISPSTPLTSRV